ncbi:MAG: hypothetical protein AB1847_05955 [bacterium]
MIQFRRSRTGRFIAALLSFFLYLFGCAPSQPKVCLKDGQQYCVTSEWAHRATWDACYQRGLNCEEGECWEYAIEEFQQAIALRFKDKRNVRAYGLHFLDEYFPHRELGICYFHLGRIEDALKELEMSRRQTPSARANYYLNQVHRAHLLATGKDSALPVIRLELPDKEHLTNRTPFIIQGTVEDDEFVSAISINHTPVFIESAQPVIPFTFSADLEEGWNAIKVTATDLVDRQDQKSIRIYLDQQGPLVITKPVWGEQSGGGRHGSQITLTALVFDHSGIVSFRLNDQEVPRAGLDQLWLIEETISPAVEIESIPFSAQDRAGNITRGVIYLRPGRRRSRLAMRMACLGPVNSWTDVAALSRDEEKEEKEEGEGENIVFNIVSPPQEDLKTYYQEIFLEGEIEAQYGIRRIKLNGKELSHGKAIEEVFEDNLPELVRELREKNRDTEALIQTAYTILGGHGSYYLNQTIPLRDKLTTIVLRAEDNAGNERSEQFRIRKIEREEVFKSEERMCLAIIPFNVEAGNYGYRDEISIERIRDKLLKNFVQQGRFNLLEQEKLPWNLIEKAYHTGKMCAEEVVRQIGESTLAEGVICGSVRRWMDGIEIKAWVRETEKGRAIIPLQDVFTPVNNEKNREVIISGLAMKFRDSFPICQGKITKVGQGGESILVDIGSEICTGIRAGMMYNVFLDERELIDKARIEKVEESESEARFSRGERKEEKVEDMGGIAKEYQVRTR